MQWMAFFAILTLPMLIYNIRTKGEATHNDFERFDDYSTHPLDFSDRDAMMQIISDGKGACFERWEDANNEYALVLMRNMGNTDFGAPIIILTINPLH